jgi:LPS-assembly lipoprotein
MQRRAFLRLILAGTAGLALSGCGFRLRGLDAPGPVIDELALAGPDTPLARRVKERLEASGTRVHDAAPLVLNLGAEAVREQRLSVLDTGPRELEMTLAVPFSVQRRADGAYHLAQQHLEVSERFIISDAQLLVQEEIREETLAQLHREAARRLLDRLRSL